MWQHRNATGTEHLRVSLFLLQVSDFQEILKRPVISGKAQMAAVGGVREGQESKEIIKKKLTVRGDHFEKKMDSLSWEKSFFFGRNSFSGVRQQIEMHERSWQEDTEQNLLLEESKIHQCFHKDVAYLLCGRDCNLLCSHLLGAAATEPAIQRKLSKLIKEVGSVLGSTLNSLQRRENRNVTQALENMHFYIHFTTQLNKDLLC